jgi:hypothetical protein
MVFNPCLLSSRLPDNWTDGVHVEQLLGLATRCQSVYDKDQVVTFISKQRLLLLTELRATLTPQQRSLPVVLQNIQVAELYKEEEALLQIDDSDLLLAQSGDKNIGGHVERAIDALYTRLCLRIQQLDSALRSDSPLGPLVTEILKAQQPAEPVRSGSPVRAELVIRANQAVQSSATQSLEAMVRAAQATSIGPAPISIQVSDGWQFINQPGG